MGATRQLFVEGRDDQWVIANIALLSGFSLQDPKARDFNIVAKDSVEQVIAAAREAIEPEYEIERLGVVIDRDTFERNNWVRLAEAFRPHYTISEDFPHVGGTILRPNEAGRPVVGVWLMPDNKSEGMLEDFLISMVPSGDQLLAHAQAVVPAVPASAGRFQQIHQSKAIAHTWLAWQRSPGLPFGTAIKCGYLDVRAALPNTFAEWLNLLFKAP